MVPKPVKADSTMETSLIGKIIKSLTTFLDQCDEQQLRIEALDQADSQQAPQLLLQPTTSPLMILRPSVSFYKRQQLCENGQLMNGF